MRPCPALSRCLPWAVCGSAALTIFGSLGGFGYPWMAWVFKPLTTLLVILFAALRVGDVPRRRRWVLAGLLLSLVGDVALLWPQAGFVTGLSAFLLAHLCYIVAFTATARLAAAWGPFAGYALLAVAVLSPLWPDVPAGLRGPVLAYVVCLAAMGAQAAAWWRRSEAGAVRREAGVAAVGGALFLVSDSLLAVNKFAGPLPGAALWVLSTYWAAQWCIASSLRAGPGVPATRARVAEA
ncbi:lysoplasmalogenase [Schlegelella sp. S2-27]|uniref:Lysoplasmalogenase n=1 Tax=Caldimonas mangrovi TaxID=2944811 RepID=A0ABT0YSK0_9BURK|nr:lysoplasmalogenase [Caldimonas mangrovi]MCM5681729.1 lysoplasmalogenase [Caldimonas mangrovi]